MARESSNVSDVCVHLLCEKNKHKVYLRCMYVCMSCCGVSGGYDGLC